MSRRLAMAAAVLTAAWLLAYGNELSLWIEPPPPESEGNVKPAGAARVVSYRLVNGRVESRPAALPSN